VVYWRRICLLSITVDVTLGACPHSTHIWSLPSPFDSPDRSSMFPSCRIASSLSPRYTKVATTFVSPHDIAPQLSSHLLKSRHHFRLTPPPPKSITLSSHHTKRRPPLSFYLFQLRHQFLHTSPGRAVEFECLPRVAFIENPNLRTRSALRGPKRGGAFRTHETERPIYTALSKHPKPDTCVRVT
jgi:hypothetical protein